MAKHAGRSKPGSKPVQLYVRLFFRPLVHLADHVGKGNFKVFSFLETAAAAAAAAFVRNAFNKFPDFFVQAFKIVADP